ncbi:pre-mRNA cleavage complex II protein family [Wolffia australiana]
MSHPEIIIPFQWTEAAESIIYGSPPSSTPIIFICGPKNSGKSTFGRHLCNVLLHRYDRVGFLDTDVGQPEFSLPGCLSLHLIDEQCEDLAAISVKAPLKCHFFGDISSKRDPKAYLARIFHLFDYFVDEHRLTKPEKPVISMLPLVINTPGWVKGIGYDLLVEMIQFMKPTHVVQIRTTSEAKNLPAGAFWLDGNKEDDVSMINIAAPCTNSFNETILVQKQAQQLRENRIVSYFRQIVPAESNISTSKDLARVLASIPPYKVSISGIKIRHLHCHVPDSERFHSLNATIVGLAISSKESLNSKDHLPWCVGLGIIRGIDIFKDVLYVITPVPLCDLEKVDVLLQGLIRIPTCLLQVRGFMCPYMSSNVLNRLDPAGMDI